MLPSKRIYRNNKKSNSISLSSMHKSCPKKPAPRNLPKKICPKTSDPRNMPQKTGPKKQAPKNRPQKTCPNGHAPKNMPKKFSPPKNCPKKYLCSVPKCAHIMLGGVHVSIQVLGFGWFFLQPRMASLTG